MAISRRFFISTDSEGWSTIVRRPNSKQQNRKLRKSPLSLPISRIFTIPAPISCPDLLPSNPTYKPSSGTIPNSTAAPSNRTVAPTTPYTSLRKPNSTSMDPTATFDDPNIAWYYQDPGTKKVFQTDPCLTGKLYLDPILGPSKLGWKNRCYTCLVRGHSSTNCRAPICACARCFKSGHDASTCLKLTVQSRTANLLPRGNLGPDKLPRNRPKSINVILRQSSNNIHDLRYLLKGVVIDGRLKPGLGCGSIELVWRCVFVLHQHSDF